MEMGNIVSNELIFYIGLALTVVCLLGMIIHIAMSKVRKLKLKTQLDSEYGEQIETEK